MNDKLVAWLKDNPEPSLQELVVKYDGLGRVPVDAWAAFNRARAEWSMQLKMFDDD